MTHVEALDVAAAMGLAESIRLKGVDFVRIVGEHLGSRESGALRFDVPELTATWLRVEREVRAMFPFVVNISASREGKADAPLGCVQVTIRLVYEIKPTIAVPSSEQLRHYVGISGYMHSWPYLRAEVQSLSAKIGFPQLTLPVIVSGHAVKRVRVKEVQPGNALVATERKRVGVGAPPHPRRMKR